MAGKKILTQFALPVGSTSGTVGNGTAGQVLATGGSSASMYWKDDATASSSVGTYSGYLQMDNTGSEQYTINHGLGTQDVIVQVRRYATSTGSTRAQRFSNNEGTHLDMGVECLVVPCDSDGDLSSNHVSLDFTNFTYSNNDYVYYTIIG